MTSTREEQTRGCEARSVRRCRLRVVSRYATLDRMNRPMLRLIPGSGRSCCPFSTGTGGQSFLRKRPEHQAVLGPSRGSAPAPGCDLVSEHEGLGATVRLPLTGLEPSVSQDLAGELHGGTRRTNALPRSRDPRSIPHADGLSGTGRMCDEESDRRRRSQCITSGIRDGHNGSPGLGHSLRSEV